MSLLVWSAVARAWQLDCEACGGGGGGQISAPGRSFSPSAPPGRPHLCHLDELVQHLRALCGPRTAQHHDLHPAGHAVAEPYGSLQGRAAPHGALQNVAPQVLGLGVRWASGWAVAPRPCPHTPIPLAVRTSGALVWLSHVLDITVPRPANEKCLNKVNTVLSPLSCQLI